MYSGTALCLVGLVLAFVFLYTRRGKSTIAPLPPGPKGLPFLGHAAQFPTSRPWETFAKWGEIYGGIVYVSAFGKPIIVLNDVNHAHNMLTKKSRLYSERPTYTMAGKLIGWDESPALTHLGDAWTEYRRFFFQFMGTRAKVQEFDDVLHEEINSLLERILGDAEKWTEHVHKYSAAIVLRLAYGYQPKDEGNDAMVKLVKEAMSHFSEMVTGGAFFVDVFPILQYVPAWFPGADWKKKIPRYRNTLREMLDIPYEWANEQIASGNEIPCFMSNLPREKRTEKEERIIKWAAGGIYSGGADTTAAGIEAFFFAMTVQPSAQRKAQEEIDRAVGPDRLPASTDRTRLPYCEALLTEVLRTQPFIPLGFPRVVTEDDVYNGYFIPKGSMICINNWSFRKDPKTYAKPEEFSPERFLASEGHAPEADPRKYLFGYGRRSCPGVHLADASMWLACVSILAAFDIAPVMKDGKPNFPSEKYTDESISHPEPFECVIKPRSKLPAAFVQGM